MHHDLRVFARLAKAAGKLRGLDDSALWNLFSRGIADDDMRPGVVAGVHPQIVRLRYAKSEIVVVARGASDEYFVSIGRKVTANTGNLLGFGRFLRRNL